MIEAVFFWAVCKFTSTSMWLPYTITGYMILPSETFFLTIGAVIGLLIYLGRHSRPYCQAYGGGAFLAVLGVYSIAFVLGVLRGTPYYHIDFRALLLTSIVVPWVFVLGQQVRVHVIAPRLIKCAIPLAVWNCIRGYTFIAAGAQLGESEERFSMGIFTTPDFALLMVYLLALARCLSRGGRGIAMVILLAASVLAPLNKPVVATFFVATVLCLFLYMYFTLRNKLVGIIKSQRAVILVVIGLSTMVFLGAGLKGGAGLAFIRERFLKESATVSKRDVSTGRFDTWRYSFGEVKSHPLLGKGMGTRVPVYGSSKKSDLAYHNYWIKMLVETGIPGFSIIVIAFSLWSRRAWKTLRDESSLERFWPRVALVTFVWAMALISLAGEYLGNYTLAYMFWTALALEAAAHSRLLRMTVAPPYVRNRRRGGQAQLYGTALPR